MNGLIKIDLNQTISKTEQKEKKVEQLRWGGFSFIIGCFLCLIITLSVLIINVNTIIKDQNKLND